MKPKFNIGDTVYTVRAHPTEISIECPHCFGKKYLTIIMGDDSQHTIDCSCCGGDYYGGSIGRIKAYQFQGHIETIVVNNIELSDGKLRYNYSNESKVFATREEAKDQVQKLVQENENEEKNRLEKCKEHKNKTWASNVTYHRRQLKDALRNVEYHTKKLAVAKEHAKEYAKEKEVLVYES